MAVYLFLTRIKSQMDFRYLHESENCFLLAEWRVEL